MSSKKAVFLDRDGVLNEDVGYAHKEDQLSLLPGVQDGVEKLKSFGFQLFVVTNQSGVARGMFTLEDVDQFNIKLNSLLSGAIEKFYVCPFLKDAEVAEYRLDSEDRKPGSGMLTKAIEEFSLDSSACFMVGDKQSDIEAGQRIGIKSIQIKGRYDLHPSPEAIVSHFSGAVEFILKHSTEL